jgi:hypothetical protein
MPILYARIELSDCHIHCARNQPDSPVLSFCLPVRPLGLALLAVLGFQRQQMLSVGLVVCTRVGANFLAVGLTILTRPLVEFCAMGAIVITRISQAMFFACAQFGFCRWVPGLLRRVMVQAVAALLLADSLWVGALPGTDFGIRTLFAQMSMTISIPLAFVEIAQGLRLVTMATRLPLGNHPFIHFLTDFKIERTIRSVSNGIGELAV